MASKIESLEIIRANESHTDEVAVLFDAYRVFYAQPSDPVAARFFIQERLRLGDSVIFLARSDIEGEKTALGFAQLYPTYSSVSMKRLWILNDLYVDGRGRRKGVGRALIDRARQLAIETDAWGLVLETAKDNHAAQALYDSTGFSMDTEFYRYNLLV